MPLTVRSNVSYALCRPPSFDIEPDKHIKLGTTLREADSQPKRPDLYSPLNHGQIPQIEDDLLGSSHVDSLVLDTDMLLCNATGTWAPLNFLPDLDRIHLEQEVFIYAQNVETVYFNPDRAFMAKALPIGLAKDWFQGLFSSAIYMVTGIKVAAKASIVTGELRRPGGAEFDPDHDLTQLGIPIIFGSRFKQLFRGYNVSHKVIDSPFVLAYETRKIKIKKLRLFRSLTGPHDRSVGDVTGTMLDNLDVTLMTRGVEKVDQQMMTRLSGMERRVPEKGFGQSSFKLRPQPHDNTERTHLEHSAIASSSEHRATSNKALVPESAVTWFDSLVIMKQTMRDFKVWSGLTSEPLSAGYTRITWESDVGQRYTSDVKELKTGGITRIFGNLKLSRGIKIISMGNTANTVGNLNWTTLSKQIVRWAKMLHMIDKKGPILPQQTTNTYQKAKTQQRLSNIQAGDILMMCMQRGKSSKSIHQEDLFLRNVDNDRALFFFLREMFTTQRGALRSYLSLRTVRELKLVEFRLPLSKRPFIPYLCCPSNTCRCLPPKDRIVPAGNEYRCTSSGGGDICPPVPAEVLTDCFENPKSVDSTQTWLLELMPKRVCGRLQGTSTEPAQGWGISYEEGWDHEQIGLTLVIVFLGGSLLFGVAWTVWKNDIQGAFGVAAWWLSASTILLGYVAMRED